MKARIKHTQQIIEVDREPFGWLWVSPQGNILLDSEELVFLDNDYYDWQSFRAETAREFISSIISSGVGITPKDAVDFSIQMTDELIERLKGKEEK